MSKAPKSIWIHPEGNKWSAKPAGYSSPEVEYVRADLSFVEVIGDAEATRRIEELERKAKRHAWNVEKAYHRGFCDAAARFEEVATPEVE